MSDTNEQRTTSTLVIQTAFLGDVLLGIPLFKALRQKSPQGQITLVCRKGIGSFFTQTGLVDEILEIDKKSKTSWQEALDKLAGRKFDVLLCPHESFRSALFAFRIDADLKIGFKRFFNFIVFNQRITRPLQAPEALRQLALLTQVEPKWESLINSFIAKQAARGGQGENGSLAAVPPEASMSVSDLATLRRAKFSGAGLAGISAIIEPIAETQEPIIVLAPGSVWRTKMWTKEGYIKTAQEFSRTRGALTVVMGAKDEIALCEEISNAIPNSLSIAGRTTLFESAQLLSVADLLICNDSGAMHLGSAAGIPIISVFGPTVLEFGYRPWSNEAQVVQIALPCRPCGKHGAQKCPIGTHACMKDISFERVLKAADAVSPISATLGNNHER